MMFILGLFCGLLLSMTIAILEIWTLTTRYRPLIQGGANKLLEILDKKEDGEVALPDETEDKLKEMFGDLPEKDL